MMTKKLLPILVFAVTCHLSTVSWLSACPLCVDATPYKKGLFVAVFVLLPIPILLGFGLFLMIRRSMKAESEAASEPSTQL